MTGRRFLALVLAAAVPAGLPADAPSLRRMEAGFARGDFDFIAAGRALLADADWAAKLRDGRPDAIVRFDPSRLETLD